MIFQSTFFLLLAASSGYYFCRRSYDKKYELARESGHRLYLTSLSVGFVFLFISWIINKIFFLAPIYLNLTPIFILNQEENGVVICVFTGAISFLYVYYKNSRPHAKEIALNKAWLKNDMDVICSEAIKRRTPIAISLDNRKIYVGMIADTLEPNIDNSHITIVPMFSGYRDKDTLEFRLVSTYFSVFNLIFQLVKKDEITGEEKSELMAYYMAFPREKINSFHIFNDHLHAEIVDQNIEN